MGALSYARLPARPLFGVARFHAIAPPRVSSRPTASQSVPYRWPPTAVPHQAKRRKRPVFSLFFAVLAVAPPARIELATLALGKPCSIQLSYGGGRRRLSRPAAMLKLCPDLCGIFNVRGGAQVQPGVGRAEFERRLSFGCARRTRRFVSADRNAEDLVK